FLPLIANTLLVTLWPWYASASLKPPGVGLVGALIVVSLTAVPFAAAYAALVQRTLDVRLVLRRALQYVLARWFIARLALLPFVALIAVVASNRERSVTDLVTGPTGLTLAALTGAGFAAALGRRRLLTMLDRRFFRQQVDARAMLVGVADAVRQATSLEELSETQARAAESAFHPQTVVTFV